MYLQEVHDGGDGLLGGDDASDVVDPLHALLAGPLLERVPLHADAEGTAQGCALDEDGVHGRPDNGPELGHEGLAAGGVVRLGADGLDESPRLDFQAGIAAQADLHLAYSR